MAGIPRLPIFTADVTRTTPAPEPPPEPPPVPPQRGVLTRPLAAGTDPSGPEVWFLQKLNLRTSFSFQMRAADVLAHAHPMVISGEQSDQQQPDWSQKSVSGGPRTHLS